VQAYLAIIKYILHYKLRKNICHYEIKPKFIFSCLFFNSIASASAASFLSFT